MQNYEDYINKKTKNIDGQLNLFFKKEFINSLKFEEENYSLLHIAVLNDWQKLVTYLVTKWSVDIDYKDSSGNSAWNHACMLLKKENALAIKSKVQINEEDRIFLEKNIDLLSRKKSCFIKPLDKNANKNRFNIINYYYDVDEVAIDAFDYFKNNINLIEDDNNFLTINNKQTLQI
ncbi:hypothetical protein [Spiroplasma endosymbiont of Cleonymus obscurus]|uniref:hypothetical protein n=1 Tax=Spiroplasma endosymbiont of Cleonymus obscurus TaxID=3066324 RepID=UPI0037DC38FC